MRRRTMPGTWITITMALSGAVGLAQPPPPVLEGRAVLPADTVAPGPPSGAALAGTVNGITFPRPGQPVQGFSAVMTGRHPGEYLVMPDNGYGGKANSTDFLIRAYYVQPDFKTAHGGSGTIAVRDFVSFRDPDHLIGFPIVREGTDERYLTGGDIDPESLQRGHDGDFWMGDEFGPWILHFDAAGRLLEAPYAVDVKSPNNPFLGGDPPSQPNSRGFEGMAITPNGRTLYAALEGATVADGASTRRHIYEFATVAGALTGNRWQYRTENAAYLIADMWALDQHRLAVIERDGGRGLGANFRGVYLVDLRRVDAEGFLDKVRAVDLTAVADPDLVSLPPVHEGDVGLGDPFRVTCESVEAIHAIDGTRLLIGCDNNLPNTGRNPGRADDNELIVVKAPGLTSGR